MRGHVNECLPTLGRPIGVEKLDRYIASDSIGSISSGGFVVNLL